MTLPSWIGGYQVVRELGRGGMGVVYEAKGPAGRVAVKVLLDPDTPADRFLEEARALGRLDHPNLIRLVDTGEAQGRPYLVMPFVEGEPLDARLARGGPLDPADAAALVATLARALDHVHTQGFLHRDIKPGNVLLTADGPVLTDFGLARDEARERTRLTRTGMMLGTPGYMSPEQASGEVDRIGPASDIYGLGALLYALLTGRPPFTGPVVQVLKQVLTTTPQPPSRLVAGLTPELDRVVLRALAQEPEDRFPSAAAFAEALAESVRGGDRPRSTPAVALAAAVLLAGVVGAGLLLRDGPRTADAETPAGSATSVPDPEAGASEQDEAATPPPALDPGALARRADESIRRQALEPDPEGLAALLAGLDAAIDAGAYELTQWRALALISVVAPTWEEAAAGAARDAGPLGPALELYLALEAASAAVPPDPERLERLASLVDAPTPADDYWLRVARFRPRMLLNQLGRYDGERWLDACRDDLAAYPHDALLAANLARALVDLGRRSGRRQTRQAALFEEGTELLERLLGEHPDSPRLLLARAMLREFQLGGRRDARLSAALEQDLRHAIRVEPEGLDARRMLGFQLLREGRMRDAEAEWVEVVRRSPGDVRDACNRVLVARGAQRLDALPALLEDLVARFPRWGDAWEVAARCHLARYLYGGDATVLTRAREAAERFRDLAPEVPHAQAWLALIRHHAQDPRWDRDLPPLPGPERRAHPVLRAVLARQVRERELKPALERRDTGALQPLVKRCLELLDPDVWRGDVYPFWPALEHGYLLDLIVEQLQPEWWPRALEESQRTLEALPEEPYFHYRVGWTLKVPVYVSSTQGIELARFLGPADARTAVDLLHAAQQHYTRALELAPAWSSPWKERGFASVLLRDDEAAVADLERCLELAPDDPVARQLLDGVRAR